MIMKKNIMTYHARMAFSCLLLMLMAVSLQLRADDMKEAKNFWMNSHSNYMTFTVLVTDLHAINTWAKDGYIKAYDNPNRSGTPITLLRVYTKDMDNDEEPLWEVFAKNMVRGSKAFMQNTVPMGDADPQGALKLDETTFYVNKGSGANDTYVIIDYYYSPELAGKTWYFYYEYEHNSSGHKVMSLGSNYCSETVDCSHFDAMDYSLKRSNLNTIEVKLPAMPNDIDQKLQDVRKHVGHYDLAINYTLFDGTVKTQTEAFDCQTQAATTANITIPSEARNFKTIDITLAVREALEADGGACFWDERKTLDLKNVFPHDPQPSKLGADFLQFDNKVDLTWNAFTFVEGLEHIKTAYPYVYRIETDQYGTPKSGQSWTKRDQLSSVGDTQHRSYADQNVAADGKYYKYLIMNVPKDWENQEGLNYQALQSPSEETINSLGHVFSNVVSAGAHVSIFNLKQDVDVKDKVRLTWEYSRVPVTSSTASFEVWRCVTGTANWETYATGIMGEANPKAGYTLAFVDADLPSKEMTFDYKVVLKLNGGKDQFESNVVTAGLLTGTTITELTATKGTHDKVVRVAWKASQVGTANSNYELSRRYAGTNDEFLTIYNTSGTSDSYTYEDNSVQPGRYYEYQVKVFSGEKERYDENNFQNMLFDTGFCQARGVITGRVTFGTSDTAVDGVRLTLRSSDEGSDNQVTNYSQRVNGVSTGIAWDADSADIATVFGDDKDYTIQMFLRPDSSLAQGAVIGEIPGFGRIKTGGYANGHYDILLEERKNYHDTYTYNYVNHWRHILYWADENKPTGELDGETCYKHDQMEQVVSQWKAEGYERIGREGTHQIYGNGAFIGLYLKKEALSEPIVVGESVSKTSLFQSNVSIPTNVFSLLSLQSSKGEIGIRVNDSISNDFTLISEDEKTEEMGDLGDYQVISGFLVTFDGYYNTFFDTYPLVIKNSSVGEGIHQTTSLQHVMTPFSVGGASGIDDQEAFRGNVTEVRVWDHLLTDKEHVANDDRMLGGRETGLMLYWPMDEGIDRLVYDASYANDLPNGRHAVVGSNINVSTIVPSDIQLSRYAVTSNSGEYTLRGIPFIGSGSTYTITPTKSIHEFAPTSRNGFISASNLTLNNYNFTDESSFVVRGKVTYLNTNIPVDSITFKVDGSLAEAKKGSVMTDSKGEYEINVPIGSHSIEAYKEGHKINTFPADGTTYDFRESMVVNFTDSTLVNVTGRINGGFTDKDAPLGFHKSTNRLGKAVVTLSIGREAMSSFNYVVDAHGDGRFGTEPIPVASATDSIQSHAVRAGGTQDETRFIHITTDPQTGEFSAMLPPLKYKVERITFESGKDYDNEPVFKQNLPIIDATNTTLTNMKEDSLVIETGEVRRYPYTAKFVRQLRNIPTIDVAQGDMTHGGFGAKSVKVTLDNGDKVDVAVMKEDENGPTYFYGHPFFEQQSNYTFDIHVAEKYKNLDTKEVFEEIPEDAVVSIMNNASLSTLVIGKEAVVDGKTMTPGQVYDVPNIQVKPDKKGQVKYTWTAGWPNLAEGFLRNLSIGVKVDGRTTMWQAPNSATDALDLVVLGGIPTGSNFITQAPDHVDMVIRRPPGNTSSATLTTDTIHNYYHLESSYDGKGTFGGAFVNLAPSYKVASGPIAFLIGTSFRPYLEETFKANAYNEEDEKEDSTYTYTISTTMKTPSGNLYTQNNGDTYIGRGTNILFSKGMTVGLFRQPDGSYKLDTKESLCFSNQFSTVFAFPQQYIEEVQIPNWEKRRESLLTEVEGDLSDDNVCPAVPGKVMYYTTLKKGDPRRGTKNIDDCWTKEEYEAAGGYPSYRMVSGLSADNNDLTDSIQWCNNQILVWKKHIEENEREKLDVFAQDSCLIGNYSIASGTSVTQTVKNSGLVDFDNYTYKKSYNVTLEFHPLGNLWNNLGGYTILGWSWKWGSTNTTTSSRTEGSQFSWTLSDSEPTTALSVNVYKSNTGWGPIFRTMGGQTSNPYEGATYTKYYQKGTELDKATMRVENPVLTVDGANTVSDVPTGGKAKFILCLTNDNDVNATATYVLEVLENSNPNGAKLTIDGDVLSKGDGGRVVKLKSGETVRKTLYVEQGSRDIIDYENIGLVLRSKNTYSTQSDPVFLNVHFVPASALVEMSVDHTVLNKELYKQNKGFIVTLTNLDRQDKGLEGVRIQYRRKGLDAWILAKEWKTDPKAGEDPIPEGESFPWPVSMPDNGIYEMRAQTWGEYGSGEVTYETDIVEVIQDLNGPQILGQPYPDSGSLSYVMHNDMHVRFNEDINGNALSKSDNFRIDGNLNNVVNTKTRDDVALQLNGDEFSTQATFDMNENHIAMEAWVYLQKDGTIISIGTENNEFAILTHDGGKLALQAGPNSNVLELDETLPANIWNYIAISYDREEGEATGLFNGLFINAGIDYPYFFASNVPVPAMSGAGKLHIGGDGMVGRMHDLAIWNIQKSVHNLYAANRETKASFTPGLMGHWKMDEGHGTTVVDRVRSRDMVLPAESWYINNRNLAAHLENGEPLQIDIAAFAPRNTDNYALEFWFRGNNVESNTSATLLQVNNRLRLGYEYGVMTLTTFEDPGMGEVNSKPKETFLLTETNYNDNQWHHLALNVRRGTSAIVYIDGRDVKTMPEDHMPAIDGSRLLVGEGFTGDIDELRVWSAVLTGEMIADRQYERLDSTYAGLIGYFPMESIHRDENGNFVADFSTENFGDNSQLNNLRMVNGELLSKAASAPALLPGSRLMRLDDSDFDFTVSDRDIYFTFRDDVLARMDGNEFTVTISNIQDKHGNISDPIVWKFNADFSIIEWGYTTAVSVVKDRAETKTVQIPLFKFNTGSEDYEIMNLPTWITTENKIGIMKDYMLDLEFTILPSAPMGIHPVYLYVGDRLGITRVMKMEVIVTGDDPNWAVDPNLYESNMIVIGQLYTGDKMCEYERSYIAAFDHMGECRGVAHPEYVASRDAYYLNMNIYGASSTEISTGKRRLTFKMYDAEKGVICPLVQLTMPDGTVADTLGYSHESLYGTYDQPVLFKALEAVEQLAKLERGWNWKSFYVQTPSTAIGDVMPKEASNVNNIQFVKSQDSFCTTKSGAFIGELTDLHPGQMYKINVKKDMTLNIVGAPIDVAVTSQTIHHDYNWIGTLSSEVMSPAVAFADLKPEKNDMVKNRTGFSMYRGDGVWEGVLQSIIPGEGYVYFSRAKNDKTFHYPKLGTQSSHSPAYHAPEAPHRSPAVHYTPVDPYTFPDNMSVVAVVVSDGQRLCNAEVAAFVNGECRGAICANAGSEYYFLTIMGSSSDDQNQKVELRVYDQGTEYVVDSKNMFTNDLVLGDLDNPYVLDLDEASGIKVVYVDDLDDDGWYTLQGVKLPHKPRFSGVYIHHGEKVVVK